jgi:hypothetical protein
MGFTVSMVFVKAMRKIIILFFLKNHRSEERLQNGISQVLIGTGEGGHHLREQGHLRIGRKRMRRCPSGNNASWNTRRILPLSGYPVHV